MWKLFVNIDIMLVFPIYWDDENREHIGNTSTLITPTRLSRLYVRPPNKQLPRVIIINPYPANVEYRVSS